MLQVPPYHIHMYDTEIYVISLITPLPTVVNVVDDEIASHLQWLVKTDNTEYEDFLWPNKICKRGF